MSKESVKKAHCLCGAVEISVNKPVQTVDACHCGMCRKWGGGPFLAVGCGSEIDISGEQNVSVYGSSDWAERGFCNRCGSHLFYRLKGANEYVLPAGLFEDQSGFEFTEQIFIDHKPGYYEFANETHNMTEAEVFAKYAPPESQ